MIKSKALYVCDACYMFRHYYKSLKKESYEKPDYWTDYNDDDYEDNDDYNNDSVAGYVNDPDAITDVELEVKNTQYKKAHQHVLSSHLQRIQDYYLKELWKNKTIQIKVEKSCTNTEYVIMTMDMCQNILLLPFKGEQPGPNYYLLPANIYGLSIHDASNKICSDYTWNDFEGKKGMDNIVYCLICWLNKIQ